MLVAELEGGTLTSSAAGCAWCLVRPFGVWNGIECGGVAVGTLLGPEGAGDRELMSGPSWFSYHHLPRGVALRGVMGSAGAGGWCLVVR